MNKLVIISGCSGGGKSTLLSELKGQGYSVIEEVGRTLVKEQIEKNSGITPWQNPELFCELLIHKSIDAFHQAKIIQSAQKDVIFFDRCILEGINYFKNLGIDKYDHLIGELRYYPTIFMAPPWKEIYHNDEERQHSFESALNEYEQISKFYPNCGYQIIKLPKVNVKERVKFMISILAG